MDRHAASLWPRPRLSGTPCGGGGACARPDRRGVWSRSAEEGGQPVLHVLRGRRPGMAAGRPAGLSDTRNRDRKSDGRGKEGSIRVNLGGSGYLKKKK